jgi:hypothetical protein
LEDGQDLSLFSSFAFDRKAAYTYGTVDFSIVIAKRYHWILTAITPPRFQTNVQFVNSDSRHYGELFSLSSLFSYTFFFFSFALSSLLS